MALLERINSMKQGGMNDVQIVNTLKEEGISPMEINEALSQSKIKSAVAGNEFEGMQQSVMQPPAPQPAQQAYQQDQYAAAQPVAQDQYAQQGYDQQAFAQPADQGAYYAQGIDIETVKDITKQQVEEALKKIREDMTALNKLKSEMKFELQDVENRLVKIESTMQEIQSSIIRKMGEYGESITGISKEIRATQDSFSKIINPLLDKKRGVKSEEGEEEQQAQEQPEEKAERPSRSRRGGNFESFVR